MEKFKKQIRRSIILLLALITAVCAVVGIVSACGVKSALAAESAGKFEVTNPTYSKVGYYAEYLGTVKRKLPTVSNEGLSRYPVYGTVLPNTTQEERQAIIDENDVLTASTSTYDSMDENGALYLSGTATGKSLYKHTAANGMYFGNVDDTQDAVIKRLHYKSRPAGDHITGLYAPAGEVIKIEISEEDLAVTGGIVVLLGQALQNGQANNIWAQRSDMSRMPKVLNKMTVSTTIGYVGSFLGGPIYIHPVNRGTEFTVTISGAVTYPHFILGYTTEEEFADNSLSSAPYFDLEVWDDCVRHSGPKREAAAFSYKDLYDVAVLWEKIASISNRIPSGSTKSIGIGMLYDTFVAAGSAVALVGRSSTNCPISWMRGSLDYDSFVDSGSWGNIHEFNHHYQMYGLEGSPAAPSEVTNNAVSLVSYTLFTRISAYRTETGIRTPAGEDGWNSHTVPTLALNKTLEAKAAGRENKALDAYSNLIHSFGQENFLEAAGKGGYGVDTWFKSVCDATHYDMTYYFTDLLNLTVSQAVLDEYAAKNYPMYVPAACVYQTGVSYFDGATKKYTKTVQPFGVFPGITTTIDFENGIVLPNGFSYKIKEVTQPENGTLVKGEGLTYKYTPDGFKDSGEFIVTISITKDNGAFEVRDVDFAVNLSISLNSKMLQRKVYTYSAENMYATAAEAYEHGYAGYETYYMEPNTNPTQNGNADIWVPTPSSNAVMEVSGKVKIPSDGKYRFILRGRTHASFYLSQDNGQTYFHAGTVNKASGANFYLDDATTYTDLTLSAGDYVYFKEVLLVTNDSRYIGMGWGKFDGDSVTISYLNNAVYQDAPEYGRFESGREFSREYTQTLADTKYAFNQTLVSSVYTPWDDTKKIDNLFDEDKTNFIHSDRSNVTAENPFEMTVDLGEEILANKFTVYGEPTRTYLPKAFKLYGGVSLDDMKLLKEVVDAPAANSNVVTTFDETTLRYYKLVVTDTYSDKAYKYIAFRYAEFSYANGDTTLLSPDADIVSYTGGWEKKQAFSTFGHIYEAQGDASVNLTFTGTRLTVYTQDGNAENFKVIIDGKEATSSTIEETATAPAYISPVLDARKHTVELVAKAGFKLDSLGVTYSEDLSKPAEEPANPPSENPDNPSDTPDTPNTPDTPSSDAPTTSSGSSLRVVLVLVLVALVGIILGLGVLLVFMIIRMKKK